MALDLVPVLTEKFNQVMPARDEVKKYVQSVCEQLLSYGIDLDDAPDALTILLPEETGISFFFTEVNGHFICYNSSGSSHHKWADRNEVLTTFLTDWIANNLPSGKVKAVLLNREPA